ncbi:MAG: serine hydrolase, partial [Flavobacterium sp.]
MITLLKKRIPFYYLIIAMVLAGFLASFVIKKTDQKILENKESEYAAYANVALSKTCGTKAKRVDGYSFVHPLVYVDNFCESERYSPLKRQLEKYIESAKAAGEIESASVYFRDIKNSEWIGYNENEKFSPGSLMKVPELITYLRMEEDSPGLLEKKYLYNVPVESSKITVFNSKSIELGKSYTIKE